MKKSLLRTCKTVFAYVLLFNLFCTSNLLAQQRYFALSLVNENDKPALETIQQAKEVGCNAVSLTVQWGVIHGKISRILKSEKGNAYNVWKQYDDQINLAVSLGMKVGINIAVSTGDDVTHSSTDRFGIDTGDGWLKGERMVVANYSGEEAVFQKWGGPIRPNINLQFVMTSLVAQSTKDRIANFTSEVVQRYQNVQNAGNLLYVNLIFTRQGEGEFEIGSTKFHYEQPLDMSAALTDYSVPMVSAYRNWLIGKYGTIQYLNSAWGKSYSSFDQVYPKKPSGSTFTEPDGTDWFLFRTLVLKETNILFKNTVKGINPNIKVITHHGSVYDKLSRGRGTLPFDQIGSELDGIKINDDIHYDHRFAIDLLRSNLPGKFYVNEAAYVNGMGSIETLTKESFTHGANMVTLFQFENAYASPGGKQALQNLTSEWVAGKQVTLPSSGNNDNFNLSDMINSDGCHTNRDSYSNDCDAYKNWRNAYNNSGSKPANIFMKDDVTPQGCFYKNLKPAQNGDQVAGSVPNNKDYHVTLGDCRVVGTVRGNGFAQNNNGLTSSVIIDPEVKNYNGQPYLQRHFRFAPNGSNPHNLTLTLYVSQSEINAFNATSSVKLPQNSGDNEGRVKLRILQWNSATITGAPDAIIDPIDNNVQWDAVLNMWRITFNPGNLASFYITAENAKPLPVTLVEFSGKKSETAVDLSWKTSEETNSDYFEIQHSLSGKQWTAVGQINAASESLLPRDYSFTHYEPANGNNLYRLKMVDADETFAYSKIISVSFENAGKVTLYPNPVTNGSIRVQYEGAAPEISLTDLNGRPIPVATEQAEARVLMVKTKTRLGAGLYILTTGQGVKQVRHKVMIVN